MALGWAKPDLDSGLLAAVTIPVERIDGAVLLIAGGDDQDYGVPFHDIAARRLEAHGHRHAWKHVVHDGAGHFVIAPPDPDNPPPRSSTTPGPGVTFLHGGTPEADARARAATWRGTLDFLKREL